MRKWYKNKWQQKSQFVYADTAAALQLVLDSLNSGQRQKLMKDERVAALITRYGVGPNAEDL